MALKKGTLKAICVLLVIAAGITAFSQYRKGKARTALARRIAGEGRGGPPQTIEGLKTAIAAYEKQIEQHVKDAAQVGVYWKILASRLQDKGLHGEALAALERALYYNPEDAVLHYLTGLSAGIMAKSAHDFTGREGGERDRLLALAEDAYLRAVELDGRYLKPRYGLGVLYAFELNRPEDAVPQMEKYLEISKSDVDAMFILARAYYMTENYRAAIDLYDRIIYLTRDMAKKTEAERNKAAVQRSIYG